MYYQKRGNLFLQFFVYLMGFTMIASVVLIVYIIYQNYAMSLLPQNKPMEISTAEHPIKQEYHKIDTTIDVGGEVKDIYPLDDKIVVVIDCETNSKDDKGNKGRDNQGMSKKILVLDYHKEDITSSFLLKETSKEKEDDEEHEDEMR